MPQTRYRSRTFRRVAKTTPGGKRVVHYERKHNAKPKCAECSAVLAGVPRGTPSQVRKLPKTQRRPDRPYGGKLCTKCMRKAIASTVTS